jgi:hypothetical protein
VLQSENAAGRLAWEFTWRTFSTCRVETLLDTSFREWPGRRHECRRGTQPVLSALSR